MGPNQHAGAVIDLAAVSGPARRVVALYDDILAGKSPPKGDLDDALTALRQAPRPGGRLGQAIAVVVDGGRGATKDDITAAFERLRHITTITPGRPPLPTPRRRRRPRRREVAGQQQLPGVFDHLTKGATPA